MKPAIFSQKVKKQNKKKNFCGRKKCSGEESGFNMRLFALIFFVFAIAGIIFFRLYDLQVFARDYYIGLADNQHYILKNIFPKRGEIFFKDKNRNQSSFPAAINKKSQLVYAVPYEVENLVGSIKEIAQNLSMEENEIREKMKNKKSMYSVIKKRISQEEAEKIENMKMKGIYLAEDIFRYYPAEDLASNVLGFVGWKENSLEGRYGIESYFEDKLRGTQGKISHKKDNSGSWIPFEDKEITLAQDGDDLFLTIDHIIQYETEKILAGAVEKFGAERGLVIVMNPKNGQIISLANYPSFNPNEYGKVENMENFKNLVGEAYECGSVFKGITLASAIDNGKINPETTYVDTGTVNISGYNIKNSDLKAYGLQTMTQVLEKSLNTGSIYAEKVLGNKNFSDYIKRFGFGEKTGLELPGENSGNLSNLENLKKDIQFFTASFGQGTTVTPIQLISAYSAIANGGMLFKPQIVEKISHKNGTEEPLQPQEIRKVISQNTANQISQMLQSVVEKGHGKRAGVPGYKVAGKTGTAQVASGTQKGYEEGASIGSFVGFAPVDNPQFSILVRLDNPKNVEWAESSAAPVFGELMKFLLSYENIEPTEKYVQNDLDNFEKLHDLKKYFAEFEKEKKKEEKKKEDNQNKEN